uniref:Uncharacterized protein n=1 Tax=Oryza rufipogon TaxID=4529 RepID=A0A0E0QGM5_ORYRU
MPLTLLCLAFSPFAWPPSLPPPPQTPDAIAGRKNKAEAGAGSHGSSLNHDRLASVKGDENGSSADNRWLRQDTLELLTIRPEMDTVLQEATLNGAIWEEISR